MEQYGSNSLLKHVFIYMFSGGITGIVGLVSLILFTRLLSPEAYGIYSVLIAIGALVTAVGFEWISQGLVRFKSSDIDHDDRALLGTLGCLFLSLSVVILATSTALFLSAQWIHGSFSELGFIVVGFLVCSQGWFRFTTDALRVEFRASLYGIVATVRSTLTLVLGTIAAYLTHSAIIVALAVASSYLLSSLIKLPPWFKFIFKIHNFDRQILFKLSAYGLPLAATLGMVFVLDSADRIMLAAMKGYEEAGVYASAYGLAQSSIGALLGALNLGVVPLAISAFRSDGVEGARALLNRNLLVVIAVGLPAVLGLIMVAPVLDSLLLGNYIAGQSSNITVIIAIGAALAGMRAFCFDIIFMLVRKTFLQSVIVGLAAILNVILNLIMIPKLGAIGAAWATLLSFAIALLLSWILGRRYIKLSLPIDQLAKIIISTVAMVMVVSTITSLGFGWIPLLSAIIGGGVVYGVALIVTNALNARAMIALLAKRIAKHTGRVQL